LRAPAAGGLDETGLESHVSFRTKVDYWRLVTDTATAPAEPLDVLALDRRKSLLSATPMPG
jgi:hypothetical protein